MEKKYKYGITTTHFELERCYKYIAGDAWFKVVKSIAEYLFKREIKYLGDLTQGQTKMLINIAIKDYPELQREKIFVAKDDTVKINLNEVDKKIIIKNKKNEYETTKEEILKICKLINTVPSKGVVHIPISLLEHKEK